MSGEDCDGLDRGDNDGQKPDKMFTLKKWNAVAMWSWDVECDTCAICRVQVMAHYLRKVLYKPWPQVGIDGLMYVCLGFALAHIYTFVHQCLCCRPL